jgi:hypothetical protein
MAAAEARPCASARPPRLATAADGDVDDPGPRTLEPDRRGTSPARANRSRVALWTFRTVSTTSRRRMRGCSRTRILDLRGRPRNHVGNVTALLAASNAPRQGALARSRPETTSRFLEEAFIWKNGSEPGRERSSSTTLQLGRGLRERRIHEPHCGFQATIGNIGHQRGLVHLFTVPFHPPLPILPSPIHSRPTCSAARRLRAQRRSEPGATHPRLLSERRSIRTQVCHT